uniref:Uncharacterized protein n=1 Tax=Mycena chlorophos TaxID=658473 RepID=A0ABQ0M0K8_MYCCL|nr:predicted protein [Mycena chlorophos]
MSLRPRRSWMSRPQVGRRVRAGQARRVRRGQPGSAEDSWLSCASRTYRRYTKAMAYAHGRTPRIQQTLRS